MHYRHKKVSGKASIRSIQIVAFEIHELKNSPRQSLGPRAPRGRSSQRRRQRLVDGDGGR
jgi:hypothetical protein